MGWNNLDKENKIFLVNVVVYHIFLALEIHNTWSKEWNISVSVAAAWNNVCFLQSWKI